MKTTHLCTFLTLCAFVLAFPLQWPFETPSSEPRLISITPGELIKVKEHDKLKLKREKINFIDLTNQFNHLLKDSSIPEGVPFAVDLAKPVPFYRYPAKSQFHEDEVEALTAAIEVPRIYANLNSFSSFHSRYYKSERALEASVWLYDVLAQFSTKRDDFNLTVVNHSKWPQPSYIFQIFGSSPSFNTSEGSDHGDATVVLGSHVDSLNVLFPAILAAPGADDDGSGVVTLLETLQVIVDTNTTFKNNVEFHFYAAEEGGMLGSLDIFNTYSTNDKSKKIVAMLQQDMTGYTAKSLEKGFPEHIALVTDYSSANLNSFLRDVAESYCNVPILETECGYPCSDHYSALMNGYPASLAFEAKFELHNPYIHSGYDTIEKLNFLHIGEHVKLCLGYVYELGVAGF